MVSCTLNALILVVLLTLPTVIYGQFITTTLTITGSFPSSMCTGDFTGNGKVDTVIVNSASKVVSILFGNGLGNTVDPNTPPGFTAQVDLQTGNGNTPQYCVTGDFNNDGKLDVAVTTSGIQVFAFAIYLGNGNTGFRGPIVMNLPNPCSAFDIISADFNKDGKPDIAISNAAGAGTMIVLLNTAPGAVGSAALGTPPSYGTPTSYTAGSVPTTITTGDFNNDGNLDVVLMNFGDSTLSVFLSTSTGTFGTTIQTTLAGGLQSVVQGDFDKDGKADLVVLIGTNTAVCSFLPGLGNGLFSSARAITFATQSNPNIVLTTDFTGDGILDLLISNGNINLVSIYSGNGAGSFTLFKTFSTNLPRGMVIADYDKNGKQDFSVVSRSGTTYSFFLNNQSPIVTPTTSPAPGNKTSGSILVVSMTVLFAALVIVASIL